MQHTTLRTYSLLLPVILLLLWPFTAHGQGKAVRYNATDNNRHGIVYKLPLTQVCLDVVAAHEHYTPGALAAYAERFLGTGASATPSDAYAIHSVRLYTRGIPDESQTYLAEFKQGKQQGYITTTPEGILCAVNAEPAAELFPPEEATPLPADRIAARLTPALPAEYTAATTLYQRAQVAANVLFELRTALLDLVSGKSEEMPQDGKSLEIMTRTLQDQIASIEALFWGYRDTTYTLHTAVYTPYEAVQRYVWARFSPLYGWVAPNDLSGDPIYLNVEVTERAPILAPEEQIKREKKLSGLIYRHPGRARITVSGAPITGQSIQTEIAQMGSVESLNESINLRRKEQTHIYLSPVSGRIVSTRYSPE